MSQHEAQEFAGLLIAAFVGFIIFILWLSFAISASASLKRIRQEAEKHTSILEQIARNTRPPESPGSPVKSTSALEYGLREPKSSAGTVLAILAVIGAVLFIAAVMRR